ncbi:PepSY domain-containing protein [Rheinheimera baltica]|uniref:PepSY domain-containing protein n=1 Tax=Rheinheimera baltica TaxID=67576 RepID=A0ABT9HU66_9GAMM|nr:PepSY domain-containing protein [Rheinheimera baltica]MDP5134672.1 PepSY domain-containing protein [Rheinheimera baltica]MDP5141573.1 PepSY domain-containing protein [Rheinheimera baltica]MDP5148809.1 PepSY domain-containing protein [Rheinheimera baltica]MDP5191996.1 PepSY domain-containing protein [Rheinheimera baltica]
MFRTLFILLTLTLILTTVPQISVAAEKAQVNREQAVALAQQYFPGKVVKVRAEQKSYRIRVLQADGRVVTVLVDGQSGRVKKDGN